MARTKKPITPVCKWTFDASEYDSEKWDTDCGEAFVFMDGCPSDNNIRFCCYCGKKLKEVKHG